MALWALGNVTSSKIIVPTFNAQLLVSIALVGTSTSRCVFEALLNHLVRHVPCQANSDTNYCRCDDMSAFVHHLKKLLVRSRCIS